MSIESAIEAISKFQGDSLTESLSHLEKDIIGASAADSLEYCSERKIDDDFVASALAVKKSCWRDQCYYSCLRNIALT
ncbi:hypothetical protein HJ109_05450 [Vibrio parahaemolyticus]|nr:hypothetical protein [Vibrio parahaemolyticus]